jgi:hypothetical protein
LWNTYLPFLRENFEVLEMNEHKENSNLRSDDSGVSLLNLEELQILPSQELEDVMLSATI